MIMLAIKAKFPLGTFLGHQDVARVAEFPDTARLHAALLHAAGTGSTAVLDKNELQPSAAAVRALEWLEEHPPSALVMPPKHRVSLRPARSWRNDGVIEGTGAKKNNPAVKKVLKPQSDAVAVGGPFGWAWDEAAPTEVVSTLKILCEDVSCLGESDSPAVLEVADDIGDPTHKRDTNNRRLAVAAPGEQVVTPAKGRTQELLQGHRNSRPKKKPTPAQDAHSWSQAPTPSPAPTVYRHLMRYRRVSEQEFADSPWTYAWVAPTNAVIKPKDKVKWCVAMHRALIAQLSEGAPPLLTGKYPKGEPRPANHVAIHYLEASAFPEEKVEHGAFVLLVPQEFDSAALSEVFRAFHSVRSVYCADGAITLGARFSCDDLTKFWSPPNAGMIRLWRPSPALIAETRRQRHKPTWSLADAAMLSIGHAFRHVLHPIPQGPNRYRQIVEQVRARGVRVYEPRLIADSKVERYAHRLPEGLVAQPYTVLVDLGEASTDALANNQTLFALGQSRHLGGGLMHPNDVTESYLAELRGNHE